MIFCKSFTAHDLHVTRLANGGYAVAVATLGGNLRELRKARGLSIEKLAERMGHKRPSTVQSWEKNRRRPRPAAVRKLAAALGDGATPADLLRDVPSDYDQLRGATPAPDAPRPVLTLAQIEGQAVAALWPSLDAEWRDVLARLLQLARGAATAAGPSALSPGESALADPSASVAPRRRRRR